MIQGILLAAGSGSRFGGGKLLHPLPSGEAVGMVSYRNLRNALPDTLVVVREGDEALRELFEKEGAEVLVCEDAHEGLSRSLIRAIRETADADGWLCALGDMPFVLPATLRKLTARLSGGSPIVIPAYAGTRGNPVGFDRRYREELLALRGDEGARSIVKRHAADVEIVECDDPGILRDIDTRADLA